MENIYITWHYTTHGIAYFKHILSAFHLGKAKVTDHPINALGISQEEMSEVFDKTLPKGFLFDKTYYLHYREEVQAQGSSRRYWRSNTLALDVLFRETGTTEIWHEAFDTDRPMREEMAYFKEKYPEKYGLLLSQYWRCIHHYTIEDQFYWFHEWSNAKGIYTAGDRFESVYMDEIDDLRNHGQIGDALLKFLNRIRKKHNNAQFFINISLGGYEAQNVWYVLAQADLLPPNTRFITTYDRKDDPSPRFKLFEIKETPLKIFEQFSDVFKAYENTTSPSRKLAYLKMQTYLKQGFAILLMGERGVGKSQIVKEIIQEEKKKKTNFPFAEASCASFDDDNKAESELFGYEKNAFTGANQRKDGLFHEAKGGILFLDELHHLSKMVQGKLMKALQTNENNEFSIRRVGSNKEEKIQCTLICATNKTIEELKNLLLPDLYDRISQLVIEFPPLRQTPEDRRADWAKIWEQLQFDKFYHCPGAIELMNWLKSLELNGNYRDLQKIAIYYKTFLDFPAETKALLKEKTPLAFAQAEFKKYYSENAQNAENQFFKLGKTGDEMVVDFKKELAAWAEKQGGQPDKLLKIAKKTYYNWRKGE